MVKFFEPKKCRKSLVKSNYKSEINCKKSLPPYPNLNFVFVSFACILKKIKSHAYVRRYM